MAPRPSSSLTSPILKYSLSGISGDPVCNATSVMSHLDILTHSLAIVTTCWPRGSRIVIGPANSAGSSAPSIVTWPGRRLNTAMALAADW